MDDAKFQASLVNDIKDDVCMLTPIYFMYSSKTEIISILFINSLYLCRIFELGSDLLMPMRTIICLCICITQFVMCSCVLLCCTFSVYDQNNMSCASGFLLQLHFELLGSTQ